MNHAQNAQLRSFEVFWRDHYDWFKDRGYLLRPRYRPGWVASWTGTNIRFTDDCEDYHTPLGLDRFLMDATRIQDGKAVMLRRPDPPSMSEELKIGRLLCSPSAQSDPRNHCVPIYETLEISETESLDYPERNLVVVMPFLVPWDRPDFSTVGEVVDFCSQIFEGLEFMHSLNIAHNDSKDSNIMMDWSPIYDVRHPVDIEMKADWSGPLKPHNRTTHPVKYYFIDWDLSKYYDPAMGTVFQNPGYGGDRTVPEFIRNERCRPFPVDVYCLGNVIRRKFFDGTEWGPPRRNVEFLSDLISDMTHDDPTKRPTMKQVVSRFEEIRKGLSWWKLRSRVSNKRTLLIFHLLYSPIHWTIQLFRIIRRIPAIPDYTSGRQ
ncbi:hypothetical protein BT96DRAFT_723002 [Gymnopus androsaceus JB14]|uniref:Protein kinase domain-containing protein n=1 Tax=Gymnopus androsaceus JB14 TaxID=1447944 RepID=A0A6A4GDW9_9AGAR|nr:hypothetical protein BT96DRAFT_723002 [Gymnopus androsaceus JB14]